MTLVLAWKHQTSVVVISDTLFSGDQRPASEVGPKILTVPIAVTSLFAELMVPLPNMGFAFAGNSGSGQFTHAMATTCLQQLTSPVISTRPSVEDVARFYARCGVHILKEQRRHRAIDRYSFEGIICGNRFRKGDYRSSGEAFHLRVFVNAEGECDSSVAEVDFDKTPVFAIGSGAPRAKELIQQKSGQSPSRVAVDVMDEMAPSP